MKPLSTMARGSASLLSLLGSAVMAQQPGTLQPEVQVCSASGCDWYRGNVVMVANWRWINKGGLNCHTNDDTWVPGF